MGHGTRGGPGARWARRHNPLHQDALERPVNVRLVKQTHPLVPAIENVIDQTRFNGPGSSRHAAKLPLNPDTANVSNVPFSFYFVVKER